MSDINDNDWQVLVDRIRNGTCTPFFGAGASTPLLPLAGELADLWRKSLHQDGILPPDTFSTLQQLAQYVAVTTDPYVAREWIAEFVRRKIVDDQAVPRFGDVGEIYSLLAEQPIPVFLTSNYDDYSSKALQHHHKEPKVEIARWNPLETDVSSCFTDELDYTPTAANPLVYHIHGHYHHPGTIVVSEDDYIDFLVSLYRLKLLPEVVQGALTRNTLLFVGYSLQDISFRVMMRLIESFGPCNSRTGITVQLVNNSPDETSAEEKKQFTSDYLNNYLRTRKWKVYWGSASDFAVELATRMSVDTP